MKKLLLLLLLVLVTITTVTANTPDYYMTETVQVDYRDGRGYRPEISSRVFIIIDYEESIIAIDTLSYIKIVTSENITYPTHRVIECYGYDDNDIKCKVELFLYDRRFYIKVTYSNFIYKYRIKYN